jgi:DNA-binding SARP family transcriptional activator
MVYRRGLQVDQGAELLYQRLIVCYQKSGRFAEAAEAYERCQQALGSLMGRQPSRETEGLGRSILATKTS